MCSCKTAKGSGTIVHAQCLLRREISAKGDAYAALRNVSSIRSPPSIFKSGDLCDPFIANQSVRVQQLPKMISLCAFISYRKLWFCFVFVFVRLWVFGLFFVAVVVCFLFFVFVLLCFLFLLFLQRESCKGSVLNIYLLQSKTGSQTVLDTKRFHNYALIVFY